MKIINKIFNKPRREWQVLAYRYFKDVKHLFASNTEKSVVSIIGCQRSGSTMMYEIFAKDPRSKVYGEFCSLNSDDKQYRIRLNEVNKVKKVLERIKYRLVVLKPLVESQHVDRLTKLQQEAKCIWLFRDFRDVAASNIKKWGANNGTNNLKAIIDDAEHNWRNEELTDEMRATVQRYYAVDMENHDAAALFWWVRNAHYFRQKLDSNDKVYTCHYSDLVSNPDKEMRSVYKFIDVGYPNKAITSHVHSKSISKGETITISRDIEMLCQELYDRLMQNTDSGYGN